jgi:hypothetical protein
MGNGDTLWLRWNEVVKITLSDAESFGTEQFLVSRSDSAMAMIRVPERG